MTTRYDKDSPALAREYDNIGDSQFEDGKILIEKIGDIKGKTVLDIGCGTGRLGRYICSLIGENGFYTGMEPLPERLNIAKGKNTFHNAVFLNGIAENLSDIPDSSVDIVIVNWVFHWIGNKASALNEIKRVLRSDGKAGITFTPKELSSYSNLSPFMNRIASKEPYNGKIDVSKSNQKQNWVETTEFINLIYNAGFIAEEIKITRVTRHYKTAHDALRFMRASTFGNFISHIPEELKARFQADLELEISYLMTEEGISLPASILFAIIKKSPN
jgi:arsenite methyltransferase